MALSPIESLNVFTGSLSTELRSRSLSSNLVQTRAPFLRFTTAAIMSDLATKFTSGPPSDTPRFSEYNGCQFFTLGLHGYNNINYSVNDLYGTQAEKGLVIGTTYKSGQQILVNTFGGQVVGNPAKNYPPPGITNAKVERLRNGNVLRFTIETQCYTQEQLEMLDIVCYVPGMTCILEWGTQYTTSTGQKPLTKTLDFKDTQKAIDNILGDGINLARSTFIEKWCAPNDFNYDWAVANIANIKTSVQNNIYKTTIIAYGRADNLMYISAYATSNPLTTKQVSQVSTSVTNFFKLNGEFSNICRDAVKNTQYQSQIIRFTDRDDAAALTKKISTSQQTGQANDIGLEDSYFMTIDFFISVILNGPVKNMINDGLASDYKVKALLAGAPVSGEEVILCGYNKNLRSTSPEVMIIFNNIARTENSAPKQIKEEVIKGISTDEARKIGALRGGNNRGVGTIDGTIAKLQQSPFDQGQIRESGQAPLSRGVWINSKAIQAAFINARTIMEGMETLLNNMNAATENYWDLKLFYDEEQQLFRIVDDNLRRTDNTISQIYEFNKRLSSIDGDTIGPDVLDIQIQTDYPKIFFSQLAISGINNLSSSPIRKEKDFRDNTSVRDIFTVSVDTVPTQAPEITRIATLDEFRSFITTLFGSQVTLYGTFFNSTIDGLDTAFASGISSELQTIIRDVFANNTLLTRSQAQGFKQRLDREAERGNLDQAQSAIISQIFLRRAEAIIRRDKQNELANLDLALRDATDKGYINPPRGARQVIREKIEEDRDRRIADLRTAVASVEQTQAVKEQTERDNEAVRRRSAPRFGGLD
jgi:hypothetical protein